MKSKNNPSANIQHNINKLLDEIIESKFFERDYNSLTVKLLYEDFSYDKSIESGIKKIKDLNIF